ncbi:hypothetical protein BH09VER1_BH09VER1_44520 [soil metagenome]
MLVCLVIVGILVTLALSAFFGSAGTLHPGLQALSCMKQLQLATQQMAMDGATNGKTDLGWPGNTGGTFTNWEQQLVPEYLWTNDLCKLLSVPGHIVPPGSLPMANTNGIFAAASLVEMISSRAATPLFDPSADSKKFSPFILSSSRTCYALRHGSPIRAGGLRRNPMPIAGWEGRLFEPDPDGNFTRNSSSQPVAFEEYAEFMSFQEKGVFSLGSPR